MDIYNSVFKELKNEGYIPENDLNVWPIDGVFKLNIKFERNNMDTTKIQNIVLEKGLIELL